MATKLEFLVAKLKVLVALATASVAISSPVITKNYNQTKPKCVSQTLKEHGSKNSAGRCSCKLTLSLPEVTNM